MKQMGIRFLLDDGQFLQLILTEQEAKKIIDAWINKGLPYILGDPNHPLIAWAVKVDSIKAIHTFDPSTVQQQIQQTQQPWRGYPGMSGVN